MYSEGTRCRTPAVSFVRSFFSARHRGGEKITRKRRQLRADVQGGRRPANAAVYIYIYIYTYTLYILPENAGIHEPCVYVYMYINTNNYIISLLRVPIYVRIYIYVCKPPLPVDVCRYNVYKSVGDGRACRVHV
jgi:hypothetical protein